MINEYTGTAPCSRHGHSAVIDEKGGGTMIIFGGCDEKGQFCTDLYIFNIDAKEWNSLGNLPNAPTGRQFHSAVIYESWMYIFAGNSNGYYNDLHRFHTDLGFWEAVEVNGTAPSPRAGHTAVVHGKSMYIYGGYDKNGLSCHDLHEFVFETNTWNLLHPKGVQPPDMYHHSAVVYQGSMYVLGGYRNESTSLQEYRFGKNKRKKYKKTNKN